jgi:xylulokinase
MTVMLSAASCLDWAAQLTGMRSVAALLDKAETKNDLDSSLLFLPYLAGERSPHNDPYARGVLFGLDHETEAADIAQAVLEGVAFGLADGLEAIAPDDSGEGITVIGGGARSAYWGRILSAALGRSLVYREGSEVGPAYGAAKLAALASGEDTAVLSEPPRQLHEIAPAPEDVERLARKRERFVSLYHQTRNLVAQKG